jgi:hypothetical protein
MLVIHVPAFRMRIRSVIMHVSLVCVMNSFSRCFFFFLQSVIIVLFCKVFSSVFFYNVFSLLVFLAKCSRCFLFCFLQSVLIAFFFAFLQSFFLYDLKNNCTRIYCARNSWFFSTILNLYHKTIHQFSLTLSTIYEFNTSSEFRGFMYILNYFDASNTCTSF